MATTAAPMGSFDRLREHSIGLPQVLVEPLVAPFLYLEFGWAMREVMGSEAGWHYTGQWWIWVLVMTVFVFLLTYRDIRISTTAGVILGAFEIVVFGALALWMIFSNV